MRVWAPSRGERVQDACRVTVPSRQSSSGRRPRTCSGTGPFAVRSRGRRLLEVSGRRVALLCDARASRLFPPRACEASSVVTAPVRTHAPAVLPPHLAALPASHLLSCRSLPAWQEARAGPDVGTARNRLGDKGRGQQCACPTFPVRAQPWRLSPCGTSRPRHSGRGNRMLAPWLRTAARCWARGSL